MRTRINDRVGPPGLQQKSDLYHKFRPVFTLIAHDDNPGKERQEFQQWYVQTGLELDVQAFLYQEAADVTGFLVGHTGIGKSTVLRYVTNDDQTTYFAQKKMLVMFVSCNSMLIDTKNRWGNALYSHLAAAYDEVARREHLSLNTDAIARYIQDNKRDLLFRPDAPVEATLAERTALLRKKDRRAYELETLKFVAHTAGLHRLAIVLDDVESLPHAVQIQAIDDFLHAFDCLQNNKGRPYRLSMLIALRPETLASAKQRCKTLTAYDYQTIELTHAVELSQLFRRRFATALSKPEIRKAANPEEWERAKDVMLLIADRMAGRFGHRIVNLANYNIRNALMNFRAVLENRRWFQRGVEVSPVYEIEELQYAVTNAGVFRALAMPRNDTYFDCDETLIANILHNTLEPESDLLVTYVLRYLMQQRRNSQTPSKWIAFDLNSLLEKIEGLFPQTVAPLGRWQDAISWMESRGLLYRLDQATQDKNEYSLTPRSLEIWDLLSENSLVLQCFREDMFRDMSCRFAVNSKSSSLKTDRLFKDCLDLAIEITEVEDCHLRVAKSRGVLSTMRDTFGVDLVSLQIARGVSATFDQYYPHAATPDVLTDTLADLRQKVSRNVQYLE